MLQHDDCVPFAFLRRYFRAYIQILIKYSLHALGKLYLPPRWQQISNHMRITISYGEAHDEAVTWALSVTRNQVPSLLAVSQSLGIRVSDKVWAVESTQVLAARQTESLQAQISRSRRHFQRSLWWSAMEAVARHVF